MLKSCYNESGLEAGCDEAGRGCLAGPVFAAAVILPPGFQHPLLNDSKQLTEAKRLELRTLIEAEALAWAVASADVTEIDQWNILRCSFLAMHRAIDQLQERPDRLLIDGNRFVPYQFVPHVCIVKGDAKFASIAAASILAKTYRDDYMLALDREFPQYRWQENKGYPTAAHREAIRQYGPTVHHRLTFRLLPASQD